MDIFEQTLNTIRGGQVLDIATSSGGFIEQLKDHLGSYSTITGIDIDAQMLGSARSRFSHGDIQFFQMDVGQLGFAANSLDTVSSSAAFHHFPDVGRALAEIKRILKPGGTFIFFEMHRDVQTEAQRTIAQIHHWAADIDTARGVYHGKTFTRQELIDFIEGMNLQLIVCHDYPETDADPMDEGKIKLSEDAIERVLQRAVDLPDYKLFKDRSEALRNRLHKIGAQWEPRLFIVGQKL